MRWIKGLKGWVAVTAAALLAIFAVAMRSAGQPRVSEIPIVASTKFERPAKPPSPSSSRHARSEKMDLVMARGIVRWMERAVAERDYELVAALQKDLVKAGNASREILQRRLAETNDSRIEAVLKDSLAQLK